MVRFSLALASLLVAAPALAAPSMDASAVDLGKRFTAEVQCDDVKADPYRAWCAVTKLGGKDEFYMPTEATSYLGLSATVKSKDVVKKALLEQGSIAVLHLAPNPNSARVFTPKAETEADKKDLKAAAMSATLVLKSIARDLKVPAKLVEQIDADRKQPGLPLKVAKLSGDFASPTPSKVYRVPTQTGAAYVTLQTLPDGFQVSVFPLTAIVKDTPPPAAAK